MNTQYPTDPKTGREKTSFVVECFMCKQSLNVEDAHRRVTDNIAYWLCKKCGSSFYQQCRRITIDACTLGAWHEW